MLSLTTRAAFVVAVVVASSAVTPSAGFAQDAPPPWVQLNVVDVDPTMVDEFIAIQREFTERAKKDKRPWRTVSRTAVFGNTYRFLIAAPLDNLATLDRQGSEDPVERSLINRVQRCITGRTAYAVRVLYEASNPLPEDEEPDLMVVNLATVSPGREQEYMDIMRSDFLPHFEDEKMHQVTGAVSIGGEGGFLHIFYVSNFAELDQGSPAMRGMSAEGAQAATKKFSGVVSRNEVWTARVVAEASYSALPKETDSDAKPQ